MVQIGCCGDSVGDGPAALQASVSIQARGGQTQAVPPWSPAEGGAARARVTAAWSGMASSTRRNRLQSELHADRPGGWLACLGTTQARSCSRIGLCGRGPGESAWETATSVSRHLGMKVEAGACRSMPAMAGAVSSIRKFAAGKMKLVNIRSWLPVSILTLEA